jgi:NTE family protein
VLANTRTRLKRMDPCSERLITGANAICDTAMRRWVDGALAKPTGFPYPASGIRVTSRGSAHPSQA